MKIWEGIEKDVCVWPCDTVSRSELIWGTVPKAGLCPHCASMSPHVSISSSVLGLLSLAIARPSDPQPPQKPQLPFSHVLWG